MQIDSRIKGAGKSERLVVGDRDTDVCLRFGKNFGTNLFRNHYPPLSIEASSPRRFYAHFGKFQSESLSVSDL
jgi:hypothetical protein